jgi:hypothetical protein
MVHKKKHWYSIDIPMPFGGNIEVQKDLKYCYICGKGIRKGQYCSKCWKKYAEAD